MCVCVVCVCVSVCVCVCLCLCVCVYVCVGGDPRGVRGIGRSGCMNKIVFSLSAFVARVNAQAVVMHAHRCRESCLSQGK